VILAGIFAGYWSVNALVRPDRNLLEELLHIGAHDAVRLELRRHHIAVKQRHREQIW
jgi:hypothetical protein